MVHDAAVGGEGAEVRQPCAIAEALDDVECAICFEALADKGGAVSLPCDCKVAYCASCWDRALAASMSAAGRATCPSCRAAMHVDFDPEQARLRFSRAAPPATSSSAPFFSRPAPWSDEDDEDEEEDEELVRDDWRRRLYAQAKPLQIRLLRSYGEARMLRSYGEGRLPPSLAASTSSAGSSGGGERGNGRGEEAPKCICGCRLRCTSTRERVMAFVLEGSVATPYRHQLEALMSSPPIVCDICSRQVRTRQVWTCENGRRTVLHAAAYDVCETCFAWHAFEEECGEEDDDSSGTSRSPDGECASDADW